MLQPADQVPHSSSQREGDGRDGERAFRTVAAQIPEFGGFHLDDSGRLVVHLTDLRQSGAARAALLPILANLAEDRHRQGARLPEIVFSRVGYSFLELSRWRAVMEAPLFALDGVFMLDLDERRNRVTVGTTDESGRAAAEEVLRHLGIPRAAVLVEVYGTGESLVGSGSSTFTLSGCGSLLAWCRPLMGGYQIGFFRDGSEKLCSIGFPAARSGETGFITASHCSDDEWNLEHSIYYQNEYPTQVGLETVDPRGWACEITFKCRNSDANFVQTTVETEVGYIARTSALGTGTRTVDAQNPWFRVSGTSSLYVGETVYTLGRSTGWLRGRVTHTCVSLKKTPEGRWHKVLCSDVNDADAGRGDSGGPVFLWDGTSDRITLVGVLFYRNSTEDHTFSSPLSGIQNDLGSLEVRAPEFRGETGGGGGGGDDGGCGGCELMH